MEKPVIEDSEGRAWPRAEIRRGLDGGRSAFTVDQIWKRAAGREEKPR